MKALTDYIKANVENIFDEDGSVLFDLAEDICKEKMVTSEQEINNFLFSFRGNVWRQEPDVLTSKQRGRFFGALMWSLDNV